MLEKYWSGKQLECVDYKKIRAEFADYAAQILLAATEAAGKKLLKNIGRKLLIHRVESEDADPVRSASFHVYAKKLFRPKSYVGRIDMELENGAQGGVFRCTYSRIGGRFFSSLVDSFPLMVPVPNWDGKGPLAMDDTRDIQRGIALLLGEVVKAGRQKQKRPLVELTA